MKTIKTRYIHALLCSVQTIGFWLFVSSADVKPFSVSGFDQSCSDSNVASSVVLVGKVLIIGGSIANFTNVAATFKVSPSNTC